VIAPPRPASAPCRYAAHRHTRLPSPYPPRWEVRWCVDRRDCAAEEVLAGGVASAESTAARGPTRRLLHEVRKDDPVSSRVFRLARTAGHPSEIAGSTALPGAKPSWVTVSLTTPWPTSSMSKATLERASARQVAAVASAVAGPRAAVAAAARPGRARPDRARPGTWTGRPLSRSSRRRRAWSAGPRRTAAAAPAPWSSRRTDLCPVKRPASASISMHARNRQGVRSYRAPVTDCTLC
jgi:hypothetical protein